ncbi:cytochrome P450 [Lentinus tigrinus ALCF2SS1-7]|uniref:Cytochrome P450 n=1 Tax=Lentinus tigrinus ALCF2SS1-6 TaxID=1328759 RepID=A0A5C2SFW9_9APHY|nr:cytochrome P450 [Lentinus tigrinus ALCF2SS1-6]RPD77541.1 cytochrome P450 [Lentinus tigrinus ALCF2SS1-7]
MTALTFSDMPPWVFVPIFLAVTYVLSHARWLQRTRGRPLPPGPKAIPFIGNVAHMRKLQPWLAHRELCEKYGELVYIPVMGQSIAILGSPRVLSDLLEKRSAVTSDHPQSPLIPLAGQNGNFSLMAYTPWWRRHRRAFWQYFFPAASEQYRPIQCKSTQVFLRKLLDDPTHLVDHIRYSFTSSIVKIIYGFDVAEKNDKCVMMMEKALEGGEAFVPGKYYVEFLPFLRHIPGWVPGAGFQKDFARWRNAAQWVRNAMVEKTQEGMTDGSTSQSVVAQLIGRIDEKDSTKASEELDIVKNVALTSYEGGADTTYSTLQTFFVAMAMFPDVQKKAQAELDAVVGPDRLPDHSDRADLPYINALVKEAVRWAPALPFSIPHRSIQDIVYDGYFIPSGTILIPNTWACLHDPEAYPDPERFMPERFLKGGKLDPDVCDPGRFAFGYGRRLCPGRYFADASLFINIAMILHVFNIDPPLDEDGRAVPMELKMTSSIVSYPEDCRCTITPRSEQARQLILANTPHVGIGTHA